MLASYLGRFLPFVGCAICFVKEQIFDCCRSSTAEGWGGGLHCWGAPCQSTELSFAALPLGLCRQWCMAGVGPSGAGWGVKQGVHPHIPAQCLGAMSGAEASWCGKQCRQEGRAEPLFVLTQICKQFLFFFISPPKYPTLFIFGCRADGSRLCKSQLFSLSSVGSHPHRCPH